jgi:hypothetical protein
VKINKLKIAVQNSAWQTLPMLATLLLSLLVVKWFSLSVWGNIVTILVVQQIVNSILAWGNKDYLQRELGNNPAAFSTHFSQLFLERFLLFALTVTGIYFLGLLDKEYFVSFVLIVLVRFVNQSFDILIIKERRFLLTLYLDFLMLILQVGWLFFIKQKEIVSLNDLLTVFWLPLLLKSSLLFFIYRKSFQKTTYKRLLLRKAFFFGMLAISGLIHSKIDVFVVSKLLDVENLGKYQIIMSFLWCIQSVSMFVSGPFVHNFYRLDETAQINSSQLLKTIGYIIVPIAVTLVMLVLYFAFSIEINLSIVMASLVFSMASFIYLPWIFQINQRKAEHRVLLINIVGTFILIGLLLGINYTFGLTLEITLWTIAVHQILITLMVFVANKKQNHAA